jgi:hypothetical protein
MEHLIQRLTNNGDVIVQFFCAVASGQPFTIRVVEKLPMTAEQQAVAQGIATPEQKAAAKKQRRFIVTRRPYYPSMAEITEAFKCLADRGFGQAPKTVQIEGSVTTRLQDGLPPLGAGHGPGLVAAVGDAQVDRLRLRLGPLLRRERFGTGARCRWRCLSAGS